ncbi:MAG: transcription termination factor NusA [Patescibacteria group bacterium]
MITEDINLAIKQICEEKNISFESVIESINYALAAAYRKDYGDKDQNIKAEFDPISGDIKVYDEKLVVDKNTELPELTPEERENMTEEELDADREKRFNPKTEIQLADAKVLKNKVKLGDLLRLDLAAPKDFGRVAAQTAKQVIIQRLKEAEKEALFVEFKDKEGTLATGVVQQREGNRVLVDINKFTALLPIEEQIRGEKYEPGQKIKVLILNVTETNHGPSVLLSRAHPDIVRELFTAEIPEIQDGTVEIKAIAREAGSRSKVAVISTEDNIDPIGSCVGQKGSRVQTIISELGGEKLDIIQYDKDPIRFISNALSPAKIANIELNEENKTAKVFVAEDQLSLAIGKGGQNVRLASEISGWQIGIQQVGGGEVEVEKLEETSTETENLTETESKIEK